VYATVRYNQYRQGKSRERSLLGSHRPSSSYGGCAPPPCPPGVRKPPATIVTGRIGALLVFLVVLSQAVAFVFFYDLPTKLDTYSKATARMRRQQDAMSREARHLESERTALRGESDRLKEERERWEKAQEDRVPQGAFWATEPSPAPDCRAYGKRQFGAELQNIPEDWTDLDACMNMPTTIGSVFLRRPDRCVYVEGSPHIHGFWMVDWDQVDCQPWHAPPTDKVSFG
jgi:hypothetical protein